MSWTRYLGILKPMVLTLSFFGSNRTVNENVLTFQIFEYSLLLYWVFSIAGCSSLLQRQIKRPIFSKFFEKTCFEEQFFDVPNLKCLEWFQTIWNKYIVFICTIYAAPRNLMEFSQISENISIIILLNFTFVSRHHPLFILFHIFVKMIYLGILAYLNTDDSIYAQKTKLAIAFSCVAFIQAKHLFYLKSYYRFWRLDDTDESKNVPEYSMPKCQLGKFSLLKKYSQEHLYGSNGALFSPIEIQESYELDQIMERWKFGFITVAFDSLTFIYLACIGIDYYSIYAAIFAIRFVVYLVYFRYFIIFMLERIPRSKYNMIYWKLQVLAVIQGHLF
eukprot:NODE_418_length_7796_cov_0.461868.p2 type:complete len:333 gc:universal NODE_418_length_7796_cov_0.461868:1949-2947(+)